MAAASAYLDGLNSEQRRAVEHGVTEFDCTSSGPLLVIAGAGSGKTNTLAHRVAHLIVKGADPRRILLMTFSRRAAAEMTKRVERISRKAMGEKAGVMTDALTWAGTLGSVMIAAGPALRTAFDMAAIVGAATCVAASLSAFVWINLHSPK